MPSEKLHALKFELCEAIDRSLMRKGWSLRQSAIYLGTSESCVSRVRNRRTDTLTFNQLFRYLAVLEPAFKMLLSI